MNKVATVESSARKQKNFDWLVKLFVTLGKGIRFVAWGKEWHHFFKICRKYKEDEELKLSTYTHHNFSETKFADNAGKALLKFSNWFDTLIKTLEEVKEDNYEGRSSERDKAEKADELQGEIMNSVFVLTLAGLIDIYTLYGSISKLLQIVNILPFKGNRDL